jgi:hypothetical protein
MSLTLQFKQAKYLCFELFVNILVLCIKNIIQKTKSLANGANDFKWNTCRFGLTV